MWHNQQIFSDSKGRKQKLERFINFYNIAKPNKVIFGKIPYEFLEDYFDHEVQTIRRFSIDYSISQF
ncbi:MAG: hypothetical protein J6583_08085 [Gilliamella sp.]|nr:hypothetical protein [Gilliamella sp.]MCO6555100.1 hypothetical protein [Gilliamella sp.]